MMYSEEPGERLDLWLGAGIRQFSAFRISDSDLTRRSRHLLLSLRRLDLLLASWQLSPMVRSFFSCTKLKIAIREQSRIVTSMGYASRWWIGRMDGCNATYNTCLLHLKTYQYLLHTLQTALSKLKEFVQLLLKLYPSPGLHFRSPLRLSSCQPGDFAVFAVRALKWLFGRSVTPFCMSILWQILLQISIAWLSCSFCLQPGMTSPRCLVVVVV